MNVRCVQMLFAACLLFGGVWPGLAIAGEPVVKAAASNRLVTAPSTTRASAVSSGVAQVEPIVHAGFANPEAAATQIAPLLQTGSLIFSKGDCLAVRIYTQSSYTHVAAVVVADEGPIVYDSMNGVGVRKLPLAEYLATQSPDEIRLFHPRRPIEGERSVTFEKSLETQLGRPYAIGHHLTGKRCDGLHCAEYVTDALMSIDVIRAQRPPKVSPASLVTGITQHGIYSAEQLISLVPPPPAKVEGASCCEQWWVDTKQCTSRCYRKLSGWFCCK